MKKTVIFAALLGFSYITSAMETESNAINCQGIYKDCTDLCEQEASAEECKAQCDARLTSCKESNKRNAQRMQARYEKLRQQEEQKEE